MPASRAPHPPIAAVVFDMDGVIVSSEERWDEVREGLARERGGTWSHEAHTRMMGMNTVEWTEYMHAELGMDLTPQQIRDEVVARLSAGYRADLPLLPGAVDAVKALSRRWALGLASSSPADLIHLVLELAGIADRFAVVMSSEDVPRGKPAPDVYVEVMRAMGVNPATAAAVEDSGNGIRAAHAAGMRVVAVPNPLYAPAPDALALADLVLPDARALTVAAVEGLTA